MRADFRDSPPNGDIVEDAQRFRDASAQLRALQGGECRQQRDLYRLGYDHGYEDGKEVSLRTVCVWLCLGAAVGAGYHWVWNWIVAK